MAPTRKHAANAGELLFAELKSAVGGKKIPRKQKGSADPKTTSSAVEPNAAPPPAPAPSFPEPAPITAVEWKRAVSPLPAAGPASAGTGIL